jgi:hypothetical protein
MQATRQEEEEEGKGDYERSWREWKEDSHNFVQRNIWDNEPYSGEWRMTQRNGADVFEEEREGILSNCLKWNGA